jgi:hypothetical protein
MTTFEKDELITTDGYLDLCDDKILQLCHIKPDYFHLGNFNWRGKMHPELIKKNVIISHSDILTTNTMSLGFNLVFCVNNNTNCENTHSLPLGIPNDCDDLEILKIIGDKNSFISIMEKKIERTNLVYMNFDMETNSNIRRPIFNFFKNYDWVFKQNTSKTIQGRNDYLISLKKSKFILCPAGNGVDTHRLWESLYMGSIPIIQNHRTHDICEELPVLFVEKWENLNKEYLELEYEKFQDKKFNFDKLKLSYWKNLIKNKILQNV